MKIIHDFDMLRPDEQPPAHRTSVSLPFASRQKEKGKHMSTAEPDDRFVHRHIGPDRSEKAGMLEALGEPSMEAFLKG
ncbi:MAG: hypothetical protein WBG80_09555, partial [Bacteroidota bacterium]